MANIEYIRVCEDESEEPVEVPSEDDGTLLLSTLAAQFPGAVGLKFRNAENNCFRGVRLTDGKLGLHDGRFHPPGKSWGNQLYICVFPKENKRKSDDILENTQPKTKRVETKQKSTDLVVLGLPWSTTDEGLRDYFEKFGELLIAHVKKTKDGQSRGYGFIRFNSYEAQLRVVSMRHMVDGRWCDVRIPQSKQGIVEEKPSKVFVGRLTEDVKEENLRAYFGKYGEVTDVIIPKPFRGFAFVRFLDPEVASSLCGEDHIINNTSVLVTNALERTPKGRDARDNAREGSSRDMYRDDSSRDGFPSLDNAREYPRENYPRDPYVPRGNPNKRDRDTFQARADGRNVRGRSFHDYDDAYDGGDVWNSGCDIPSLQNLGITGGVNSPSNSLGSNSWNSSLPMPPDVVAALRKIGWMPAPGATKMSDYPNSGSRSLMRGSRDFPPGRSPH